MERSCVCRPARSAVDRPGHPDRCRGRHASGSYPCASR
jgi:hypothetical protein